MIKASKLNDTHLVLLSAAAQRSDGMLDLAARLKANAQRTVGEKLTGLGLVEEVPADADQPAWRTDENGERFGLKITEAGLAAIGVGAEDQPADSAQELAGEAEPALIVTAMAPSLSAPRSGSKRALIIGLLQRDEGASIADLMTATGWLPHTTRAALTGLRKHGHALVKSAGADGKSVYRLPSEATGA